MEFSSAACSSRRKSSRRTVVANVRRVLGFVEAVKDDDAEDRDGRVAVARRSLRQRKLFLRVDIFIYRIFVMTLCPNTVNQFAVPIGLIELGGLVIGEIYRRNRGTFWIFWRGGTF